MRKLFMALCVLSLALTAKAHTLNDNDGETSTITATDASSLEETEVTNPSVGPNAPERLQRVSLAQSASSPTSSSSMDDRGLESSWSIEYLIPDYDLTDGSWGVFAGARGSYVDMNIIFTHICEDFDFLSMKLGGHYRIFPVDMFYVEGNVGLSLMFSSVDFETGSTEDDKTYLGFYLTPRVGIRLTEKFGITGSYNWDFFRFKTGKENVLKYFTVGLEFYF